MNNTQRLTTADIEILRIRNQRDDAEYIFTDTDMQLLMSGQASCKLMTAAEKTIKAHKHWLNTPPSRMELMQHFMTKQEGQNFWQTNILPHLNRVSLAVNVLIKKGLITEDEIEAQEKAELEELAKQWLHLCDKCNTQAEKCTKKSMRTAGSILNLLDGDLAAKVVECREFTVTEGEDNEQETTGRD